MLIALEVDGDTATVGNGVMIALKVSSREQVDAPYAKALELGGRDEGKSGRVAAAVSTAAISATPTATS